jgi:sec-independent protein translocase protein TatA
VFAFLDFLGPADILIVSVVAVLLFGERLPEVAKKAGKQFMDLKRSIQGLRSEFESAANDVSSTIERGSRKEETFDREQSTAPKFEPPPVEHSGGPNEG